MKTEGIVKYSGFEESIEILVDYMSKHGPFDGFLTFSGGQTFFRYLYRILFHKDAQTFSSVVPKIMSQPIFLISAGAHFTQGQVI